MHLQRRVDYKNSQRCAKPPQVARPQEFEDLEPSELKLLAMRRIDLKESTIGRGPIRTHL